MQVNKCHKQIYDNIHGYIHISNLACDIIDTVQFQRLRSLHQLGTCHYVFPTANHSRFEHSLGTYYLTGRILRCVVQRTNPREMDDYLKKIPYLTKYLQQHYNKTLYPLDDYICELVKIAALCHDLGHGPFSHVFDDVFLSKIPDTNLMKFHENRSSLLLEYIINNNENLKNKISQDHINFIKSIINPKNGETGFIYQIVSNYLNGIDVDKCDYIARDTTAIGLQYNLDFTRLVDDIEVIDNNICYPKQMAYELVCLYTTRYRLHKQIYRHKVTISTQFMINEIMELLDPIIGISKSLDCPIKFSTLTDDYIFSMCDTLMISKHLLTDENRLRVEHANDLHQKILRRKLYKYVGSIITDKYQNIDISKLDIQHDNVMIYNSRISSGSKNDPLENIWFYNKKKPNAKFKIDKNDVSIVLPIIQSEFVWMAFLIEENANDRDNINIFINSFKNN